MNKSILTLTQRQEIFDFIKFRLMRGQLGMENLLLEFVWIICKNMKQIIFSLLFTLGFTSTICEYII